jgi:hypothetical protein
MPWAFLALHRRGLMNTSLPFAELRARSDVSEAARAAGQTQNFSERIRFGLPPRRGKP